VPYQKRFSGHRTIGVHIYSDTAEALAAFAAEHGLYASGAAHVLLRQALGLPPILNDNPES
jgi:uncharacterized damage-inducible protein DinB